MTIKDILWKFHIELKEQQNSGRSATQGNSEIFANTLKDLREMIEHRRYKDTSGGTHADVLMRIGGNSMLDDVLGELK